MISCKHKLHFEGQLTLQVRDVLEKNNIIAVDVPANCTDRLQPMDLSVNKAIKEHMKVSFQLWYAEKVSRQLNEREEGKPVDLRLSVMKLLGVKWFTSALTHVQLHSHIVENGFREAGITDMLQ